MEHTNLTINMNPEAVRSGALELIHQISLRMFDETEMTTTQLLDYRCGVDLLFECLNACIDGTK